MRFSTRFSTLLAVVACVGGMVAINSAAQLPFQSARTLDSTFDEVIRRNSDRMLEEGRRIFRFDTFGDGLWRHAQRTRAIEGTNSAASVRV